MSDDQALAKKELSGINEKIKSMKNQIQESNIKNQVRKISSFTTLNWHAKTTPEQQLAASKQFFENGKLGKFAYEKLYKTPNFRLPRDY